jgi:hypothetical protein
MFNSITKGRKAREIRPSDGDSGMRLSYKRDLFGATTPSMTLDGEIQLMQLPYRLYNRLAFARQTQDSGLYMEGVSLSAQTFMRRRQAERKRGHSKNGINKSFGETDRELLSQLQALSSNKKSEALLAGSEVEEINVKGRGRSTKRSHALVSYANLSNYSHGSATVPNVYKADNIRFNTCDCSEAAGLIAMGGAVSIDNQRFQSIENMRQISGMVKIFDLTNGSAKFELGCLGQVEAISFSPNGSKLLVGDTKDVKVFDCKNGQVLTFFRLERAVLTTCWSSDSCMVAWAGLEPNCQIWSPEDFEDKNNRLAMLEHDSTCYEISFSGDGKWFGQGGGKPENG